MHNLLAILIMITGLTGGAFVLAKFKHLPGDTILRINFLALALSEIYLGIAYGLGYVGFIPVEMFPYVVRPGVFVLCVTPILISWRMGL